jgi:hypothetical protein
MIVFPTVLCPNSEFLKQNLKGKYPWLNAHSAKDLAERFWHVLSACLLDPLSTCSTRKMSVLGGDSSRGVRLCSAYGGLCRGSVSYLYNLIKRPDPQAVRYLGFPICCLSFLKWFGILFRLVCPLNVQKGTAFLRSQSILLCFGQCTVYFRWNTES